MLAAKFTKLFDNNKPFFLGATFFLLIASITTISFYILTSIMVWNVFIYIGFFIAVVCFSRVFEKSYSGYDHFENIMISIGGGMLLAFIISLYTHNIYAWDGDIVYDAETEEILKPAINLNFGPRLYIISEDQPLIENVRGLVKFDLHENFESKVRFEYEFETVFAIQNKTIKFKSFVENQAKQFFSQTDQKKSNAHALEVFLCKALKNKNIEFQNCPIRINSN